ncbi:hypothetical protein G6F44_011111 [Rhizopus delemar]|nr:hypothetical protein G6F44_011111 [Rhizopus delemar]
MPYSHPPEKYVLKSIVARYHGFGTEGVVQKGFTDYRILWCQFGGHEVKPDNVAFLRSRSEHTAVTQAHYLVEHSLIANLKRDSGIDAVCNRKLICSKLWVS